MTTIDEREVEDEVIVNKFWIWSGGAFIVLCFNSVLFVFFFALFACLVRTCFVANGSEGNSDLFDKFVKMLVIYENDH